MLTVGALRVNPEIEARLRRTVNFPSPPGVATHIIELAQDPDIEMGKVAKAYNDVTNPSASHSLLDDHFLSRLHLYVTL